MSANVKLDSRLNDLLHYKLRVITQDGRVYVGELMAFDKHMNLILSDCIEERVPRTQVLKLRSTKTVEAVKVEKRVLGLVILRGEHVLSTVVEDQPLLTKKERLVQLNKQEKQLRKNKKRNKGKVGKPSTTKVSSGSANGEAHLPPQTRRFQPPPGFKRGANTNTHTR
ncbi:hypothetical protein NCAS_0F03750 [Naumovozyma castellii]|uniref:Sm protein B n=1 Tax=Naumovozyma castellii TaxID=27288 RepID=G0VH86_NAUCA|nr:hypothetical protein NCAS_0F03750 [Naumovozyma castellii CBS 4309]CCC70859.1 hypothetical protein NCAS_0F03750 [Naumovozyma castellii CBS 4309]